MAADEGRVAQLAAEVLDGTSVDWAAAESEADGAALPLVKHLRVVATLAEVHRTLTPEPTATSAPTAMTPECWGHLRLVERIGLGSFGEVYRAWDTRLDREVALKLLPADRAAGNRAASSIIHEGQLLARVRHPNVATIYGAEQIGDRIGLWMEFVRGRTLEQMLERGTVFSAKEAARIGLDLCRAVSAVHAADLLHRDIKAHNVMRADDGRIVLMDFGTGRELDDSSSSDLAGTPLYVAPEVLGGQPATVQSDVYSLGVLLYHLVTGSYPVQGRTIGDVRLAHDTNSRVDLHAARSGLPSRLTRIIERAIDPRPQRRYRSAEGMGADLGRLAGRSSRRPIAYACAAVACITLAGAMAWNSRRSAPPDVPVIAVLPFENRSPEPDSEVFADGLTGEIQRNLAAIQGLELRSSMSSFTFRNKPRDLREIGSQLSVNFILEGSVFQSGETLRVNARLVRVADEITLWVGTFDRKARDIFNIQDEISLAIVNALRLKLGRGQRRYETDPDVYYQFLKARGLFARRNPENAARAADLFEQVVAKDPVFAPAWAGLSSAAADATRHQASEEMPPTDPRMEPAALRAIQIDPLLAEAHAALGSVYGRNRDWTNARKAFLTALDLNPSLTTTHTDFVLSTLMPMGKNAECLQQLEDARRVDPLSLDVRRLLAQVQVNAGLHADAIESARWVLERDPKFPYAEVFLGRALLFAGRPDEAIPFFENAKSEGNWGYLGYLYAVTGRRDEAEALAAKHPDAAARQMLIYAGLRDKDRAFEALERTAAVHWWRAATWMIRPEMAVLRGDPRVAELRQRLGLPPFEDAQ